MKTTARLALSILLACVSFSVNAWTEQPSMQLKRFESASIEYNGQLYVFNGFSNGLHMGTSIEKYNPTNKQWTMLGNTSIANGTAVTHNAIVLVGNEAWLIGGRIGAHPGPVSDKVWIYNLITNNWRTGPTLPVPMAAGGAAIVNNKIHLFGGVDSEAKCDVNFHYVLNLSNQSAGWHNITASAAMPSARNHFSTIALDDVIYAIGGQHGHDGCPGTAGGNVALVHSYTPQSNQWKRLANLPAVESHNEPSTFAHNGFIYTVGGAAAGNKVLRFDPALNQWQSITVLPEPLLAPVAHIYNDRLVVAGGAQQTTLNSNNLVRSIGLNTFKDQASDYTDANVPDDRNDDGEDTTGTVDTNSSGLVISVEAESFTGRTGTSTHQWVNASLSGASGGASMTTPNLGVLNTNADNTPMLSYNIQFAEAGTYFLWIRGWGDENANGEGSNDSVHAGLNGNLVDSADKIDGFPNRWNWSKRTRDGISATLNIPSAGVHTVNIWMREDGLAFDKFLLAKSGNFVPEGYGPDGTAVSGTDTNTAPIVNAGPNGSTTLGTPYSLAGQVSDDTKPNNTLSAQWEKVSGPGVVTYTQVNNPTTSASFSQAGIYLLRLIASDGDLQTNDTVSITVQPAANVNEDDSPVVTNGTVAIEAENFQSKTSAGTHSWINATYSGASGGRSMITTPDTNALISSAAGSPMMSYSVTFAETGSYHVWIRGWGDAAGNNDSVHAGLNNVLSPSADKIDGFPSGWNWSKRTRDGAPATITVTNVGTQTFNLWMREDGLAVDKIILTKNANYLPSGLGENTADTVNPITNTAPTVDAGPNAAIMQSASLQLNAQVSDDGKPSSPLTLTWTKTSGPGSVVFSNASNASTSVRFSTAGLYTLRLSASDGSLSTADTLTVTVNQEVTNNDSPPVAESMVAIEAEDYFTRTGTPTHQWVNANLSGASGNKSMITTPNTNALKINASDSPMMSYLINFTEAGEYQLWIRGWGDGNNAGNNDSLHAGLNGALSNTADKIDGFPSGWNWSRSTRDGSSATLSIPSAGIHSVNLWMREDGLAVDKFILTKSASYVPTGLGIADTGSISAENVNEIDNDTSTTSDNTADNNSTDERDEQVASSTRAWEMVQTYNGSSVQARHEAAAVSVNNTLYMMGGRGNRPVQSYNESSNSWTSHGLSPVLMNHFQPVAIGDKIYAIGANKDDNYPAELPLEFVYIFNTSNHTWSKGAEIPANRRRGSAGAATHNGKIYLIGGNTKGHSGPAVKWFDEFNPATNQWRVMPDAPNARDHATVAVANGKLVVAAGRRTAYPSVWGDTEAKTDVFNFVTGGWETNADNIPTQRAGTMTVAVGNEVVVIGGETLANYDAHADVEAFNVVTGKWRILQPLMLGRHSGGAAVLGNKIHVVSGNTTRGGGNETTNHETLLLNAQP